MQVALALGGNTKKIVNSLKTKVDGVDLYGYSSGVSEVIKDIKLRKINFFRVIVTPEGLPDLEGDLKQLDECLRSTTNSEVVMLMTNNLNENVVSTFNSIFNSPRYSVAFVSKLSIPYLEHVCVDPIEQISAEFSEVYSPNLENSTDFSDIGKTETSPVQDSGNPRVSPLNNTPEIEESISPLGVGNPMVSPLNNPLDLNPSSEFSPVSSSVGVVGGMENIGTGSLDSNMSFLLSNDGDHSDTGILDEDDIEELNNFVNNSTGTLKSEPKPEPISSPTSRVKPTTSFVKSKLPIDLVTSILGGNTTKAIISEAKEIVRRDKVKVLVIDADNVRHSLLSLIDVDKFYSDSCNSGVSKLRIYSEGGIDFVSNGYGDRVTRAHLKSLLSSQYVRDYAMIFIDCPIDSISIIDEEILNQVNVLVYSGSDRNSLVNTSLAITNRANLTLGTERGILEKCMVELEGKPSQKDLDFIKKDCLFANGCWLDRL